MNIKRTETVYACLTAWEHEIGAKDIKWPDEGRMPLYTSVKKLREHCECVDECGIVKLEISLVRVVRWPKNTASQLKPKRVKRKA